MGAVFEETTYDIAALSSLWTAEMTTPTTTHPTARTSSNAAAQPDAIMRSVATMRSVKAMRPARTVPATTATTMPNLSYVTARKHDDAPSHGTTSAMLARTDAPGSDHHPPPGSDRASGQDDEPNDDDDDTPDHQQGDAPDDGEPSDHGDAHDSEQGCSQA